MEDSIVTRRITQAEADKGVESNPSALQVQVAPLQKPKTKLREWAERQKIGLKLWLYKNLIIAGLSFIGLNSVDAYLTNYAHRLIATTGVEANPFMQPFIGSWALSFKGVIYLGVIGLLAKAKRYTPDKIFWLLTFGCFIFGCIILWNMYSLGVIR